MQERHQICRNRGIHAHLVPAVTLLLVENPTVYPHFLVSLRRCCHLPSFPCYFVILCNLVIFATPFLPLFCDSLDIFSFLIINLTWSSESVFGRKKYLLLLSPLTLATKSQQYNTLHTRVQRCQVQRDIYSLFPIILFFLSFTFKFWLPLLIVSFFGGGEIFICLTFYYFPPMTP